MARTKQRVRPSSQTVGKGQKNRKNLPTNVKNKRRRFKPGTLAVRKVRKMQLSTDRLLARKAFERIVRKSVEKNRFHEGARITREAMNALQDYVESRMVSFLENVVSTTIFRGKKTVQWDALEFVWTDYGTNSSKYLNGMVNMTHIRSQKKK